MKKLMRAAISSTILSLACLCTDIKAATAIPVFANGQGGVNCGLCHTAVPNLNSYGRYVFMTNLSRGLNTHLQMTENKSMPAALEVTANAANPSDPMLPSVNSALVQFLSGGFIGPKVSYFASVPVVSGGFPASSVDQVWGAYNGLSHGNGSLQVGRFPTPVFAPWTSQSLSLSGFGAADLPVGLNSSTLLDNRWGASYTQIGHLGLIGNVSYLAGSSPIEHALRSEGEGTAFAASVQYLSPESRWSGGLAALSGSIPLPSGARDPYTRAAALASYSGERYQITAMKTVGHDNNPLDDLSPAANSNGVSVETIYGFMPWLHVDLRYEHTDDGLGNSLVHYISAAAFSLRPNVVLTAENVATVGNRPTQKYQLLWSGPWYRNRFPRGAMPPATSKPDTAALANGRSIYFTNTDVSGTRISTATPTRFYQNCAVCHGPNGAGGVQLADGAVSAKLGSQAHMLDAMRPMHGQMTSWTLPLFERAISSGLDENGQRLSPVMPRWVMSERDLHDIALYISTQIR